MRSTESIRDRIKKLLALTQSSNENEAHTALLMAQKLMLKHEIDDIEYQSATASNSKPSVIDEIVMVGKYPNWLIELMQVIATNFRCKFYYTKNGQRTEFHFLGLKHDVEIARGVFLYAYASVRYHSKLFVESPEIRRKYKKKYELKKDYISGYINGLNKKFESQVKEQSFELALVLHPAVKEEIKELNLVPGKETHTPKDLDSFWKGYEDGKSFNDDLDKIEASV